MIAMVNSPTTCEGPGVKSTPSVVSSRLLLA
jgi:hypothetical protein